MVRPRHILKVLLLLSCLGLARTGFCQPTRLRYGVEWGMAESILQGTHHIITTEEGFPVNVSKYGTTLHTNLFFLANVGVQLGDLFSVSLYSGYVGITENRRIIPVTGRVNVTPMGAGNDGLMAYLDTGIGIVDRKSDYVLVLAKGGGGYRYALSRNSRLDLLLSLQMALDHPEVWDDVSQSYIPPQRVRASEGFYVSLCLSVALNF